MAAAGWADEDAVREGWEDPELDEEDVETEADTEAESARSGDELECKLRDDCAVGDGPELREKKCEREDCVVLGPDAEEEDEEEEALKEADAERDEGA